MVRKDERHKNLKRAALPAFRAQLALLVKAPPVGDAWLHELKFDGYRIGCRIDGSDISLISRNGKDWTQRFPTVRAAMARLRVRQALFDGEVAAVLPDGRTSFQALQNTFAGVARHPISYFLFDLLHLNGEDISRLALETRKRRLQAVLQTVNGGAVVQYSDHVIGNGPAFFAQACRHDVEGIVSKRRDRPYEPGRGGGWVKTKCIKRQEFVIVGFTDPQGARAGIGALLVGIYDASGALVFSGKVGTGFTNRSAQELRQRLNELEQRQCPLAVRPPGALGRDAHWVQPILVAEVAFTEWTEDNKIRHPSFQGLRADKSAREVVRETAVTAPEARPSPRRKTHR